MLALASHLLGFLILLCLSFPHNRERVMLSSTLRCERQHGGREVNGLLNRRKQCFSFTKPLDFKARQGRRAFSFSGAGPWAMSCDPRSHELFCQTPGG